MGQPLQEQHVDSIWHEWNWTLISIIVWWVEEAWEPVLHLNGTKVIWRAHLVAYHPPDHKDWFQKMFIAPQPITACFVSSCSSRAHRQGARGCLEGNLVSHTVAPSRTEKQLETRPGLARPRAFMSTAANTHPLYQAQFEWHLASLPPGFGPDRCASCFVD